jgi:lipopolysaccharide transport system permease protein
MSSGGNFPRKSKYHSILANETDRVSAFLPCPLMPLDTANTTERHRIDIGPNQLDTHYLRDCWRLRHLLFVFSWRDIVIRYRQTVAGVLWILLRPLMTMAVFALVFGKFLKVPSGEVPYPLLILSGLVGWQLIAYTFAAATDAVFAYSGVMSKVYFPRVIIPLSALVVNLVDFFVSLVVLIPFMLLYGVTPDFRILALPLVVACGVPSAAGLAMWFSAVAAKYRDFRNVIPFVVQLTLFLSPIAFPVSLVPPSLRFVYWLNPVVPLVEGVRWSLFAGAGTFYWPGVAGSAVFSLIVLFGGYHYFRSVERQFSDVL